MTTTATPTVPQHLCALERATAMRNGRARLRRTIAAMDRKAGLAHVIGIVMQPPPEVETLLVLDLFTWCRRVGDHAAHRYLRAAGIGLTRTVPELTDRQRNALVAAVGDLRTETR